MKTLCLNQAFYDSGLNTATSELSDAIISLVTGLGGKLKEFSFQPLSIVNISYILVKCFEQLKEVEALDISVPDDPTQIDQTFEILRSIKSLRKLRFVLISTIKNRESYVNLLMFQNLT